MLSTISSHRTRTISSRRTRTISSRRTRTISSHRTRTIRVITRTTGGLAVAALSLTACGGSDGDAGGGGDLDAFCEKYEVLDNQAEFDEAAIAEQLEELRDLAPSEIKGEFATAINAFEVFAEFTEQVESGAEVDPDEPALVQASEDLDASGSRIEEFATEECGLDLGS